MVDIDQHHTRQKTLRIKLIINILLRLLSIQKWFNNVIQATCVILF
jgi:hypothetical protein